MNILERIVLWLAQTTSSEVAQLDEARELANDAAGEIESLRQRLAAAEAERDITDKQLTVICEGVNRRCGADSKQLPLVSLDKILAQHARDRVNLVAWVLRNMYEFGCFTGDCPHDMNSECIESIVKQYEEDEGDWK